MLGWALHPTVRGEDLPGLQAEFLRRMSFTSLIIFGNGVVKFSDWAAGMSDKGMNYA